MFFFITESAKDLLEWAVLMEKGRLMRQRAIPGWPGYVNAKVHRKEVKVVDDLVQRYRAESVSGRGAGTVSSSSSSSSSSSGVRYNEQAHSDQSVRVARRGTITLNNMEKNQELGEAIAVMSKQEMQQGKDFDEVYDRKRRRGDERCGS
eukprot:TRINITY_DN1024_c0_g1_i5.p1 TRINITY_DN1024_c0_g1~~TRINITY_DN1024_c0_g1_i5.p1  ORF type:complete len:149 (+),score=60.50 TRINITY_DN1024_c0_g1_i5:138-584(+)